MADKVYQIDLALLDDHPDNAAVFGIDKAGLEDLAASIKEFGVLQALLVQPKEDGRYLIIAGHRRKYAAIRAGYSKVPCILKNEDVDGDLALAETNLNFRELSPMRKARAIKYMKDKLGINRGGDRKHVEAKFTLRTLTDRYKLSKTALHTYDKLNDLIPELQDYVDTGTIGISLGAKLGGLEREVQQELYDYLGDAVKEIGSEEVRRLREENNRGYLVLEVMEKKLKDMELELEERRRKEGDMKDLEQQIKALKAKKREAEFDLIDCSSVASRAKERVFNNGNALLYLVEEIGRIVAGARPKIEVLIESPFDPNTAANLLKWAQVFVETGRLIEESAEKNINLAEAEKRKQAGRPTTGDPLPAG